MIAINPMVAAPRPRAARSIPRHWTPEQAREFLGLMEGDRTYPIWAFLLGSGLRIGELVWLRWANVDLERRRVHVVDFATALGYDLIASPGKSRDAVRSIELDDGLVRVLRSQRKLQAAERLAAAVIKHCRVGVGLLRWRTLMGDFILLPRLRTADVVTADLMTPSRR